MPEPDPIEPEQWTEGSSSEPSEASATPLRIWKQKQRHTLEGLRAIYKQQIAILIGVARVMGAYADAP